MRRILIAGAATGCWTNLGDEAILAGMSESLRQISGGVRLAVVSSNPAGFLDTYGCDSVPYHDVDAVTEAAAASDLVLLGGGSIFFDYWGCDPGAVLTHRHEGLSLWAGIALLAAAHGKPSMVYGAGVGPLRSPAGELLTRAVFELAREAALRDHGSLATLAALEVDALEPTVTADAALAVSLPEPPPLDLPRPWLGVALRPWDVDVDPTQWQAEVAAAIDRFLDEHGGTALFVPCHRSVSWPLTDDTTAGEAVQARMRLHERAHTVDVALPWGERAAVLASCDLALAMRYHAALFALAAAVPTVSLSYDPKVESLLAEWGLGELNVGLTGVRQADLTERLERAWRERTDVAAVARRRTAEIRQQEAGSAARARDLLERPAPPSTGGTAVRELLRRLADDEADRPRAVTAALARLRGRLAASGGEMRAPSANTNPTVRPTATTPAKRVAILTNRLLDWETGEPCFGGAERYALELVRLLRDRGLEPTFFQRGNESTAGEYFGFPVQGLSGDERFSEFEHGVGEAFFHRTRDFDHVLYLMPNYASGAMREDAVVVCHGVWWDHDLYRHQFAFRTPGWYEHLRRVFTRPRRVVSVDANSINVVRALFPEAAARMRWIPNWVDTERFHPPDERTARPAAEQPVVLFPRRAEIVRGTRLIGPILAAVPEECRFLWVGDGYPRELEVLHRVADDDPRLELSSAPFEAMPEIYRDADICVIPTVGSEGQSLACLEAMASGCAVVATLVGGLPELIRDGHDGLLCGPDPESLAGAIRRLLGDSALRERLQKEARASAEGHALDVWQARWAGLLDELGWTAHETGEAVGEGVGVRAGREGDGLDVPYDVVCFSIINWEFRWQRPQQMMTEWARRGRRVFYLRMTDFLPPGGEPFVAEPLAENVWEIRLALPSPVGVYSGEHAEGFVPTGLEALRALGEAFGIERAVSVVDIASWFPLAGAARESFGWPLIYDCMDDWPTFPKIADKPRLLAQEREMVAGADLMVVSSRTIHERWAGGRPDLLLARNAADFAFFHAAGGEDPLPGVHGPIAGYFGAVAEWFDVELVRRAAQARPDVTFVLVGGVFDISVEPLEALPNVLLCGQQPYETMPAYLRRFDVCLVPFEVSDATAGMDVVKFYEYVSQGKPVVSTQIREIVPYGELLYLAEDAEDFLRQLDRALEEDDPALRQRRIEFARQNTWEERLTRIEDAITNRCEMPAPACPLVSVVVVTYDGLDWTRACLASLLDGETWPRLEVIVVDNGSTDGTPDYLRELMAGDRRVRVLFNETNRGFPAANNQGLRAAAGEILVLLNNDTVVPPGLLGRLVYPLRADPEIGLICPTTNFSGNESKVDPGYTDLADLPRYASERARAYAGEAFDIPVAAMYCVALRRDVLETVGLLDEAFGIGLFEDDDYSSRVRDAGYRVVCGESAYVHHEGQASFSQLPQEEFGRLWKESQAHYETKWGREWTRHERRQGVAAPVSKIGGPGGTRQPTTSYDIVCFSIINWEFRWQRPQQMMALWARRGRRVFFLRISDFLPPDHAPAARGAREPFTVTPLAENIWEVCIALPEGFSVHSGSHPEGFVAAGLEALRALRRAHAITAAVSVVQTAGWTPLAHAAREAFGWILLYDCMDDWSTFPGMTGRPPLLALEEELAAAADLMVVSADNIRKRWADRRPDALLVRNGADFAFFQSTGGDDPLPEINGPIAGFFGGIAEWFDIELVAHAARARPEVTFVLVGGVHRISVEQLEGLPNVRLEGLQLYARMPDYLRRFDACLIPFRVSPLTDAVDPVKLYEYLSQGKPVVATRFREITPFGELLYLAEDEDDFVRQLDRALAEDDADLRAQRIEFARRNTWDERLDRIEEAIGERLARRPLQAEAAGDALAEARREAERWRTETEALQAELRRWQASRLWRVANVYWRGRRAIGRLLGRSRPDTAGRRGGDIGTADAP